MQVIREMALVKGRKVASCFCSRPSMSVAVVQSIYYINMNSNLLFSDNKCIFNNCFFIFLIKSNKKCLSKLETS